MTCSHAQELMAGYWQHELTSADAPALQQHLESCAECSAEMAALGGLWERLADLPVPEPSLALDARWRSTLESLALPRRTLPRRTWSFANFWPRNPVWQAAIALACLDRKSVV